MDYEFQNITVSLNVFNFTISAGATRSFDLTIIDDNIAERHGFDRLGLIGFYVGVYDSNGMNFCDYDHIYIEDDDGNTL